MQDTGLNAERKIAHFFANASGVGYEGAAEFWQQEMANCDWLDSDCLNELREEIELAEEIRDSFSAMTDPQQSSKASLSLRQLQQLRQTCENSLLETNSALSKDIDSVYTRLSEFVKRIQKMFIKSTSYYNVFEVPIA